MSARERYRRFEKARGWEQQPFIAVVIGWLMIAEAIFLFFFGLAVVLTH